MFPRPAYYTMDGASANVDRYVAKSVAVHRGHKPLASRRGKIIGRLKFTLPNYTPGTEKKAKVKGDDVDRTRDHR